MKRVLAFASALALAVGAFAPAAFADDNVPAQIPITDLYADPELYDLYVAPYYNNLSFQDWGDYATDAVISGFPMNTVKQIESTEGGLESLWNTVHNAFTFGYNIGQDWVSKLYVDTSDGRLKSDGNIMTDDLKALLDSYFKTSPASSDSFDRNGHSWVAVPYQLLTSSGNVQGIVTRYTIENQWPVEAAGTLYASRVGNNWIVCSWILKSTYPNGVRASGSQYTYGLVNSYYNYYDGDTGSYIQYLDGYITGYKPNIADSFSSRAEAEANFYSAPPPSGDATWNGDGYYRDDYNVDIALPAIPAIDWQDLNNKYYTEYGGDFVEGDVSNFYYDISYNYFPAEYTYSIPYWLIDGNSSVLDFNYSLELPTVDLYELPSEFDGGEEVWDSSFTMLGGFGAFILLGFSFGLVALFFKD